MGLFDGKGGLGKEQTPKRVLAPREPQRKPAYFISVVNKMDFFKIFILGIKLNVPATWEFNSLFLRVLVGAPNASVHGFKGISPLFWISDPF